MKTKTVMQTTIGRTHMPCLVEVYATDPVEFGFVKPDLTPDPVRRGMARPEDIAKIEYEIRREYGVPTAEEQKRGPRVSWSRIPNVG